MPRGVDEDVACCRAMECTFHQWIKESPPLAGQPYSSIPVPIDLPHNPISPAKGCDDLAVVLNVIEGEALMILSGSWACRMFWRIPYALWQAISVSGGQFG
jgi:hypothetical protein